MTSLYNNKTTDEINLANIYQPSKNDLKEVIQEIVLRRMTCKLK